MDEIEWIKHTKKALIMFAIIAVVISGYTAILILIIPIHYPEERKVALLGLLIAAIAIPLILGFCFLIINIVLRILKSGRTVMNFDKSYIRELPKQCSPAICSLIYDLKIDVYKDYTATVLFLCIKKYINLIKDGDSYKLEVIKEQDSSNLGICEKYVLDIIQGKDIFDENKFKQEIIKEAQEKELIKNKRNTKIHKILLIWIIPIILLIITFKISKIVFYILLSIFIAFMWAGALVVNTYVSIKDTDYKRTKDGKNIAILLGGLKRYIRDYTLIKDKEIDYVQILESYIPYALSLDEADAVEEFIKYHEQYRNLIYNRKNM